MTSMTSVRIITQKCCQEPGRNFTRNPHPSVKRLLMPEKLLESVGKREWILRIVWVVCESVCLSRVPGIDDQLQRDSLQLYRVL